MAGRAGLQLLGGRAPGAVALVARSGAVTYGELDARVERRIDDLGLAARSVVVLAGPTGVELVVTYLALLRAGHVPLLAGDHAERLADAWRPAAVVTAEGDGDGDGGGVRVEHLRAERRPLHPDLALLLSTSGSTGSPKLVRLSAGNVASNARAIASYLRLGPGDRGITSLPLHYCYGLSVLHSHLVAGASVVLTTASVVDPCFARAMDDHGVTNLAGVPHTFDLLERAGAERIRVPSLRFLTQAGGRMAPDAVTRWHRRAAGWGAELFVMYGQTEATARMAYLPPALAAVRPGAVGVPIPGGALEVRPVPGRTGVDLAGDVGELVYTGPNVMLGYATTDADLAEGATLTELRTGDLGRFDAEHGVFEVVGRLGRIVKPFGLRLDLDAVEAALAARNVPVTAAGDDELLVLAVVPGGGPGPDGVDRAHVAAAAARVTGLPASRVAVVEGDAPRTSAGKTDYGALLAAGRAAAAATGPAAPGSVPERSPVAAAYASLLGGSIGPATTFVSAGGDSLSYVECSLLLERALGRLPDDWHLRTVAELDALAAGAPARRPAGADRVDTTVVLRAVGICAVVATHMGVVFFPGGAHLLLAVVGFNLSRFQLALDGTGERVRAGLRSVARVALPTMAWTAGALLVSDSYGLPTLALVNNYAGGPGHADGTWHFWFIEAFVQLGLAATALLAVPAVRRLERRHPYWFPLGLLLAALQLRTVGWFGIDDPANLRFRTHGIAWFFVLGWLVHRSTAPWQKGLTTVVAIASVTGFFGRPQREWFILAGLLTLAWCRRVPCPRPLQPVVATLAGASFWIFVSHFQLWRPLARLLPLPAAYPATLLAGVALWAATDHATRHARTLLVHRRPRPPTPTADQAAPAPPPPAADRPAPTTPAPVARPAGDRPVEAPV